MIHRFTLRFIGYVLGAALAIAVPPCAAAGPTRSTAALNNYTASHIKRGWIARDAKTKHAWLYVTGYDNNQVSMYDLERVGAPQVGLITDGVSTPNGVTIDSHGTVYVANKLAGNVTVYAAGQTSPTMTLSTGLTQPISVAIDASGNVYVSNRGNAPSIVVYPPGQTTPSRTITDALLMEVPTQVLFDSAGDLYFSDAVTGVNEIPLGSQYAVSLGLKGIAQACGLAIDPSSGNLFVSQAGEGPTLVFAPGRDSAIRELEDSSDSNLIALGSVKGREYLFMPHAPQNVVTLFKMHGTKQVGAVFVTAQDMIGVAIKPAGVP